MNKVTIRYRYTRNSVYCQREVIRLWITDSTVFFEDVRTPDLTEFIDCPAYLTVLINPLEVSYDENKS